MKRKQHDLKQLIIQAEKSDAKAQTILLNSFWDNVFNYVNSKIRNENDAEDISIQAFTKAFSKLHLYNNAFDFKTWLVSIAHNTMLDFLKKNKIDIASDEATVLNIPQEDLSPEEILIHKQNDHELKDYLNQLKPHYRKVLELYYLEEKSYKEIAQEMDISMSNVKIMLLRAKNLLSRLMIKSKEN